MKGKFIDLTGEKINRLLVIRKTKSKNNKDTFWECICDCGKHTIVNSYKLRKGVTKSCGCLREELGVVCRTHGKSHTPEYLVYFSMKKRCYNTKEKYYHNYGGRGITVCERWLNSFENFFGDMGERPSKNHTLDRFPNQNGNYEPTNCRWATWKQQMSNLRNNVYVEFNGQNKIVADWAVELGIPDKRIYDRLKKGHPPEIALSNIGFGIGRKIKNSITVKTDNGSNVALNDFKGAKFGNSYEKIPYSQKDENSFNGAKNRQNED